MEHPRFTGDEIVARGKAIYNTRLRDLLEPEHKGEVILIDIETGDYEFKDENNPVEAYRKMLDRHPGAAIYGKRIGYVAVTKMGGRLREETS